jgi:adenosine deaminase
MYKLFFSIIIFLISFSVLGQNNSENLTKKYFEIAKKNPKQLQIFLYAMPKGGELHDHLGGASMAENMIHYAKEDHLCIDRQTLSAMINPNCSHNNLLQNAEKFPDLYNAIIDAWSMRHFNSGKETAHDHCFAAFFKFWPILTPHSGDILSEMTERAGKQNIQYLEIMVTPDDSATSDLGKKIGWDPNFTQMRVKLLNSGLKNIESTISKKMDNDESTLTSTLLCKTQQAKPGCHVKIRYLYQVLREQAPEQVFAQLLQGFELTQNDSRFVGINMVQAENGTIAMRDYHLHMQMIEFLHHMYPKVHITLHAGESGPAIAPSEALRFHIREAVEIAHAKRIGHGLDISYENNATQLLKEMSKKHILVEMTPSTEAILGFEPKEYPLPLYLSHGVPIAISTDDEGLMRTNLTKQFEQITSRYNLSYSTLKNLVRNSIRYSFVSGNSLWVDYQYHQVVRACKKDHFGSSAISATCQAYLDANEKARLQWELENRFIKFENRFS